METFSALLAFFAGNSPVTGELPSQRPVTRSFHVFVGLRLNKWLSKQSWGWWFRRHRAHYDVTLMYRYQAVVQSEHVFNYTRQRISVTNGYSCPCIHYSIDIIPIIQGQHDGCWYYGVKYAADRGQQTGWFYEFEHSRMKYGMTYGRRSSKFGAAKGGKCQKFWNWSVLSWL